MTQPGGQPWPIAEPSIPSDYCNPPTDLNAIIEHDIVKLSWKSPHDNDGFYLNYWQSGIVATQITVYGDNVQLQLPENTPFNWSVRTMCNRLIDRGSDTVIGVPFTVGPAAIACPVIDISNALVIQSSNTVRLQWTEVPHIVNYMLEVKPKGTKFTAQKFNSPSSFINLTILAPGVTYQWRVKPDCIVAYFSEWSEFTTGSSNTCPAVEVSAVIDITSAVVYWTHEEGIKSYQVYVNNTLIAAQHSVNMITLSNLIAVTEYNVIIIPNCDKGPGGMAMFQFKTTDYTIPNPSAIQISKGEADVVNITWVPAPGIDSQEIMINGSKTILDADTNLVSVPNVPAGNKLNILIKSVKNNQKSPGMFGEFTMPLYCQSIESIVVLACNHSSIKIGWRGVSGATRYRIRYRKIGDAAFVSTTIVRTDFSLTILEPESTYIFEVSVLCASDSSAAVTEQITTTAVPECDVVTSLVGSNISSSGFKVSFDISGVQASGTFKMVVMKVEDESIVNFYGSASPIEATGLTANKAYSVYISNECSENPSSSEAISISTLNACTAPTSLAANLTTSNTTLHASWTAVSGVIGYKVAYKKLTDSSWINLSDQVGTSFNVTGLSPALYQVKVTSKYADGRLCSSTVTTVIPKVLNLSNNSVGNKGRFSWDPIAGVESYLIVITSLDDTIRVRSLKASAEVNLEPATNYTAVVKAFYSDVYGADSDAVSHNTGTYVYPEDTECVVPEFAAYQQDSYINNNTITVNTKTDITVRIKNYTSTLKYEIQVFNKIGSVPVINQIFHVADEEFNGTTVFSGLPDGNYKVLVTTIDDQDRRCENAKEVTDGACDVIDDIVASSVTDTSFVLTWTAAAHSVGYEVYLNDELYNIVANNEITIEDLSPETEYKVGVANRCDLYKKGDITDVTVTTIAS